jgi:hypothetical protein
MATSDGRPAAADITAAVERTCSVCWQKFTLDYWAQAWFAERGLHLPKRCQACRDAGRGTATKR